MKTTLLISLLCLGSLAGNAQFQYTTKDNPPLINNGKPIPVTPAFSTPFKVVDDTPCYMYKKHGLVVVNCPGVWFAPETTSDQAATSSALPADGNLNVISENNYTGYYPVTNSRPDPEMPANAIPVRPSGEYKMLQDPPCYIYTTKKGLEVMECHGLWFPPEHHDK